jgi:hypothetical protein
MMRRSWEGEREREREREREMKDERKEGWERETRCRVRIP